MWVHTGDPRVTAISYEDAMLQITGGRRRVEDGAGGRYRTPEGEPVEWPAYGDTTALRALRFQATGPIRAAPHDSSRVIVPAVIQGEDCLVGREVQGEWLRGVSSDETCDFGRLDLPRETEAWVRWTDGRDNLYWPDVLRLVREARTGAIR